MNLFLSIPKAAQNIYSAMLSVENHDRKAIPDCIMISFMQLQALMESPHNLQLSYRHMQMTQDILSFISV